MCMESAVRLFDRFSSILDGLQTLDETGQQIDQQTVTIVQPAENEYNDQQLKHG